MVSSAKDTSQLITLTSIVGLDEGDPVGAWVGDTGGDNDEQRGEGWTDGLRAPIPTTSDCPVPVNRIVFTTASSAIPQSLRSS